MKIEGRISILIGADSTSIEIEDNNANTQFVKLRMTASEFQRALSRECMIKCELYIKGLDKIGKKHENKQFSFPISDELRSSANSEKLRVIAQDLLDEQNEGWIADSYFGSQGSFSGYGDKCMAHATVRRWI